MDVVQLYVKPVKEFAKDSMRLVKRCTKPDLKGELVDSWLKSWPFFRHFVSLFVEFQKIAIATAIGFAIMGFIGFFVKLIHIPINNIIVWVWTVLLPVDCSMWLYVTWSLPPCFSSTVGHESTSRCYMCNVCYSSTHAHTSTRSCTIDCAVFCSLISLHFQHCLTVIKGVSMWVWLTKLNTWPF